MPEFLLNLQSSVRFIDILDVGIVALIVYRVLLMIKGTRAMQMLTGLGILGVGFFTSSTFELFTTHWMLSYFFDHLILIIIVLFQDDLRKALANVGKNPFFQAAERIEEQEMVEEISRSAARMAKEKIGGLIVIERETGLKNFIDTGSQLDAKVKGELLYSIFERNSPLHDGAVIITGGRIAAAGCFLPLSNDPSIDKKFGTRHRAALGLSEDTDAVIVLISEEAGEVHLVKNAQITMNLSEQELKQSLNALLDLSRGKNQMNVPRRMRGWLLAVKAKRKDQP